MTDRPALAQLLAAGLLLLVPGGAVALDPEVLPIHYSRRAWTTDHGLPQDAVQAIVQDDDGYLWIGTQEGLVRFDGVRFTVLSTRSTPALPGNNIRALLKGGDDALWLGTRGSGLARIVGDSVDTLDSGGLRDAQVRTLADGGHGRIWVGTRGHGLFLADARGATRDDRLAAAMVLDLEIDRHGTLWAATEGDGVCRMDRDSARCFTTTDGLPHNLVWTVYEDHQGRLWVGTYGGGLARFDGDGFIVLDEDDGLTSDRITALLEDRHGNLWIGTAGGGLNRLTKGTITALTSRDGLGSDTVHTLFEDAEGSLWVGTAGNGLVRLRDSPFRIYSSGTDATQGMPRVVLQDSHGTVLVGFSQEGLHRVSDGHLIPVEVTGAGSSRREVFALHEDARGALWVGTYGSGVSRLSSGRWTTWTSANGLPHDTVWSITTSDDGTTWIGTYGGGLVRLEGALLETFTTADGLSSNLIRSLLMARDGTLWIGTSGGGVCTLTEGHISRLGPSSSLDTATVFAIHEDAEGRMWFGTNGRGLHLLTADGTLTSISIEHGLFDNLAYQILEDDQGRLWMSCNRGIYAASMDDLLDVAAGRTARLRCVSFGRPDGMPTAECNGGSQPAGCRTRDGQLWFPTPRGVVTVDPARLLDQNPIPPVLVEEVLLDGRSFAPDAAIEVPPGTLSLDIRYTAPTFLAPERVEFRYRLAGLDDSWTQAGRRRSVNYSRPPPGSYRFEVSARSSDGEWNPHSAVLPIVVEPEFVGSRAFFLACAAALAVAGFGAASLRTAAVRRRERRLSRLVEERTGELLDVTRQLADANRKLQELSMRDPLTGVANRRSFDKTLALMWAQAQRGQHPISILMIDVDHFKRFNDSHGHLAGDQCLSRVAGVLAGRLRRASDVIARYGGEEFVILLDAAPGPPALALAEGLRAAVEAEAIPHGSSVTSHVVTVSVGVASTVPKHGYKAEDLTGAADRALYRAKDLGRNRVEMAEA